MKKGWKVVALVALAVLIVVSVAGVVFAAGPSRTASVVTRVGNAGTGTGTGLLSTAPLTADEAQSLVFMREEEKLARDVYLVLYEKWGVEEFKTIAASETRHMASVERLLDRYGLPDPVATDVPGEFVDNELQAAYDELVRQGLRSLEDAYQAGVTIEELDIADLQGAIDQATHRDIDRVLSSLLRGSEHHLESFNALLVG